MGVAHHAAYLVWYEVGRGEYLAACGIPYGECERRGVFLPVYEASCRYLSPARYWDRVTLTIRLAELRSRGLRLHYRAHAEDGRLLASGSTTHICLDGQGKVRPLPDWFRRAIRGGPRQRLGGLSREEARAAS